MSPHEPANSIRPAIPEDAPAIVRFQIEMALESEGLNLDAATVADGVRAVFDDPSKGSYVVAERGDEVVGVLLLVPEWSDWRNGTVLWIHSVFVAPWARRSGVYAAMYAHLQERVAADTSLRGLRLYVDRTNRSARAVYERLGMDGSHYDLFEWLP